MTNSNREKKDTEYLAKFPYDNQISPITLKIDKNVWEEFKKRVPRNLNLNHAIAYLIERFVFIEKGDFANLNPNELWDEILKDENNFIIAYGEDFKGNKVGGRHVKCANCTCIGEIGVEIFGGLCQSCGENKSKKEVKHGKRRYS